MDRTVTPLSISLTAILTAAVEGGARPGLLETVARAEGSVATLARPDRETQRPA